MDYQTDAVGGNEVEEQLQRFQQAIDDLRGALSELAAAPLANSQERQMKVFQINRVKQEAAVCSRSLSLELRCSSSVLSPEVISRLVRRQQQLRQEFMALSAECEEQLLTVSKDQLLERYGKTHEPTQDQDLSPQQQRQQLIMLGDEVQDKTQLSLARTQLQVAETEDMGGAILQRMQQQNDQLDNVKDKLEDVEFNIGRTKKTAQAIAKNAASDRCLQCLCCCVVLLLIASVVLIALPGR
ncbi:vesicle transport v-SNARE domain-containing protein, putative [Eimeria tenella]|uniref:Vesicle transport v-SNARE domain-containing protein, putative n=1 Tax=Eimeria tenella TaxID=5802 RepID=U6KWA5_EIMTE|nr:vesicle transport v-SNARE domain-containing protein, putative [Eimeria tenella]CDJ42251.1 vesicle transport v-SNARE domain-containing protein, putative [Eimeria tenella]|eukprot:XP_013233001.1 vesicle transport v-SNARE domain-containing protein, putative [Eimeria tenella]